MRPLTIQIEVPRTPDQDEIERLKQQIEDLETKIALYRRRQALEHHYRALLAREQSLPLVARRCDPIIAAVCAEYGVTINDILGRKRPGPIVEPRQVAHYFCRELTEFSLNMLGLYFRRDHGTILSSINTVEARLATEPQYRQRLQHLRQVLECGGERSETPLSEHTKG